jgi:hypothetical protein
MTPEQMHLICFQLKIPVPVSEHRALYHEGQPSALSFSYRSLFDCANVYFFLTLAFMKKAVPFILISCKAARSLEFRLIEFP